MSFLNTSPQQFLRPRPSSRASATRLPRKARLPPARPPTSFLQRRMRCQSCRPAFLDLRAALPIGERAGSGHPSAVCSTAEPELVALTRRPSRPTRPVLLRTRCPTGRVPRRGPPRRPRSPDYGLAGLISGLDQHAQRLGAEQQPGPTSATSRLVTTHRPRRT